MMRFLLNLIDVIPLGIWVILGILIMWLALK